jgi:hypothetical protein
MTHYREATRVFKHIRIGEFFMASIAFRRCRKIIGLLFEKNYMPDDVLRWQTEIKPLVEREIADDPRTVALYRKRLVRWGFLTLGGRGLFRLNRLDRYGNPLTYQDTLKSTKETVEKAIETKASGG